MTSDNQKLGQSMTSDVSINIVVLVIKSERNETKNPLK